MGGLAQDRTEERGTTSFVGSLRRGPRGEGRQRVRAHAARRSPRPAARAAVPLAAPLQRRAPAARRLRLRGRLGRRLRGGGGGEGALKLSLLKMLCFTMLFLTRH